jgi:hypothetical protein
MSGGRPRIERLTVRFEDVNGPRRGIDTICRMKVVMSGADSVLIEQRARTPEEAVARAVPRLVRAVQRTASRTGGRAPGPRTAGALFGRPPLRTRGMT